MGAPGGFAKPEYLKSFVDTKKNIYQEKEGPHSVGRRWCAAQVFSPRAKTLAQAEFISAEHGKKPMATKAKAPAFAGAFALVRLKGFEPPTFWFVAKHSIQLSYSRLSFSGDLIILAQLK